MAKCGNLRTSHSNHKENSWIIPFDPMYIPAYYLRQPVPVEDFGKSNKKDVLNLIDVKWRGNVEKSTLKVNHNNISQMEKAKSTMIVLDMNLRIQITWRGNDYVHVLDWFWWQRLFRVLMCRWRGYRVVRSVCFLKNKQNIQSVNCRNNAPEVPERLLHSFWWVLVTQTSE